MEKTAKTRRYEHCPQSLRTFGVLALVFASLTFGAYGQDITGRIVGTVRDNAGAVVPNAEVSITNEGTGIISHLKTNSSGDYTFAFVPLGTYAVGVKVTGFRPVISTKNDVVVGQDTRVDFTLQVGSSSEHVVVEGSAPLIATTTSGEEQVITSKAVHDIPLNGRIFSQLVQTIPGATPAAFADATESSSGAGAQTPIYSSINGIPFSGTTFLIDGVNDEEPLNAFINIAPPVEAIEEMAIQTQNPNVSYGSFGGGVVSIQIKSGTNSFHGSGFEFLKNDALNADNYFSTTKADFKSNQFGGSIGGPIIRNKAFFFGDYQGLRLSGGVPYFLSVPSLLMRQGIFSAAEGFGTIYDPSTATASTPPTPFPNNQIPMTRWDPTVVNMLNLGVWPAPNVASSGPYNNYFQNVTNTQAVNAFDIKGDYQTSHWGRFFARESYATRNYAAPSPGTPFIQNGDSNSHSFNHNAVIGWTDVISSNFVNELRIGFNRFNEYNRGNDYGQDYSNQVGIPNGNLPEFANSQGFAQFNIGANAPTGSVSWDDSRRVVSTYQINEGATLVHGVNTFRFGTDLRLFRFSLTNPVGGGPRGTFTYSAAYTSDAAPAYNPNASQSGGDPWASFLLGDPTQVSRDFLIDIPDSDMKFFGLYAGDDVRVSSKLTLNLGLRWDLETPQVEAKNHLSNLNVTDSLIHIATPSDRSDGVKTYYGGWAPRLGFAYSPDKGKTSIRGAYGISYFPDNFGATGGTLEFGYPFSQNFSFTSPTTYTPFWSVASNGLPGFTPAAIQPTYVPPAGLTPVSEPANNRFDAAQMWNFGIQRQVDRTGTVEIAYVGTHAEHLFRFLTIDDPPPGPGPLDPRRPFYTTLPQVGNIVLGTSDGSASYNALQASFKQRLGASSIITIAYTWSKNLDDLDVLYGDNLSLDHLLNRAPAPISTFTTADYPQVLVATYTYEIPIGRNHRLLGTSGPLLNAVAGGWSINGITNISSGPPIDVYVANSLLNNGLGNRPDVTCSHISTPKNVNEWFNTNCFSNPAPYVFGNYKPGDVRAPGIDNWDMSIFKKFHFGERSSAEFRAEFFNAFNDPHFGPPANVFQQPGFGTISSTAAPNRQIQFGLRLAF
jgi:Carboxypeptidase regulatory-like domain/TonB-dependent Receptor Plug Domain